MAQCSVPLSIGTHLDQNEFDWHMPLSTAATFDWPDTRNDTVSGRNASKVANAADLSSFWEVDANSEYADRSQTLFGQCFLNEPIPLSESELKRSTTSSPLFSSDDDVLQPDATNLDICVENSPTLLLDQSLDSVWPWTKLGESAAVESELLEDGYRNIPYTTRHASGRISRTPSLVSSRRSVCSSPVCGSPSEKSRSRTPERRRRSCSSTSSNRKRKPKEQARRAHAQVERRYRDNLNSKILQLQECLDRSRQTYPGHSVEPESMVEEGLDRDVRSVGKALRKADVLTEAIQYINETEVEIRHISNELCQLRSQLARLQAMGTISQPL